jgi:hypothetical protein
MPGLKVMLYNKFMRSENQSAKCTPVTEFGHCQLLLDLLTLYEAKDLA